MDSTNALAPTDDRPGSAGWRRQAASRVGRAIEHGVLALVCLAPWAFGATAPKYVFFLDVGLACLMVLWGARMLLEGHLTWRKCPVAACLGALVLVAAWQVVPLPRGLIRRISPATARMYDRLLPARPEVLPAGAPRDYPTPPAGSTLSVDPGATRRDLGRLLAVLMLFAIVLNNVDPAQGLRRLGMAALINGSLLALFGLVQVFSSDPQTIYWIFPTAGSPFGPFINRNHFAFYMNVCIGLGAGLLLARLAARNAHGPDSARQSRTRRSSEDGGILDRLRQTLGPIPEAETLGIIFALALMTSSVVVCLSRGGLVALVGGSILGLAIWVFRSRRSTQGRIVLLTPAVALALVCWLGYDPVATRLATLWSGAALREQRPTLWARALPVAWDFPLWGTGCGTYELADMLHRADAADDDMVVDHAHNDYLEMLVEGGLAQLVPGVLAMILVFRLGLSAARRLAGEPAGGMALGALIGFATVAIHSFSDFGLHIPSCAALAVVLAALLCGLGSGNGRGGPWVAVSDDSEDGHRTGLRLRRLAPALGAGLALALGLLIAHEGWRAYRVQQIRSQASDLDRSGDPARLERKVAFLEAAARLVPENARLQIDLFFEHLDAFEQRMYALAEGEPASDHVANGSASPRPRPDATELGRLRRDYLAPALRHLLRSRDLCPMRAMVHLEIAEHIADFVAAEPREAYLERAKLLAPADPGLWYRCGLDELADGRPDRAWASWRRSLELSDRDLPAILERSIATLGPRDTLRRVFPDKPALLMAAAVRLPPLPDEGRRLFRERALAIVESRPGPPSAEELHTRATIQRALGRPAGALKAYKEALMQAPDHLSWRSELAELAYEQGRFEEAHQELLTILALQPGNMRARTLLDEVAQGLAEHR